MESTAVLYFIAELTLSKPIKQEISRNGKIKQGLPGFPKRWCILVSVRMGLSELRVDLRYLCFYFVLFFKFLCN